MKNFKIVVFFFFACFLNGVLIAQECSYYSLSKGMVCAYQNLDGKGKITGSSRITCLDVVTEGLAVIYKVKSEYADVKNNNPSTREYEMRCEDGKFYLDMQNFVDPKSMEGFKDMEVSVDSKDMMYPSGLTAGQELPDASVTISAATGGLSMLNLTIYISNRKVAGIESVTVPAGTFDCYKITYDVETKMMFKMNTSCAEYVNIGVGNVKTETFDKKGKILGTTVLSELKR